MNKTEYLQELKRRLAKLPQNEIEGVLEYYDEYFNDAGQENEQKVIEEIGNPAQVASQIIANFAIKDAEESNGNKKGLATFWLVILAIFASPIALPLALVVVSLAFALIIVIASLIFSFGAVAVSLILAGILYIIGAIFIIIFEFPTAIFLIGIGLFLLGLGLLSLMGTIALSKKCSRWIVTLISKFLLRRTKV